MPTTTPADPGSTSTARKFSSRTVPASKFASPRGCSLVRTSPRRESNPAGRRAAGATATTSKDDRPMTPPSRQRTRTARSNFMSPIGNFRRPEQLVAEQQQPARVSRNENGMVQMQQPQLQTSDKENVKPQLLRGNQYQSEHGNATNSASAHKPPLASRKRSVGPAVVVVAAGSSSTTTRCNPFNIQKVVPGEVQGGTKGRATVAAMGGSSRATSSARGRSAAMAETNPGRGDPAASWGLRESNQDPAAVSRKDRKPTWDNKIPKHQSMLSGGAPTARPSVWEQVPRNSAGEEKLSSSPTTEQQPRSSFSEATRASGIEQHVNKRSLPARKSREIGRPDLAAVSRASGAALGDGRDEFSEARQRDHQHQDTAPGTIGISRPTTAASPSSLGAQTSSQDTIAISNASGSPNASPPGGGNQPVGFLVQQKTRLQMAQPPQNQATAKFLQMRLANTAGPLGTSAGPLLQTGGGAAGGVVGSSLATAQPQKMSSSGPGAGGANSTQPGSTTQPAAQVVVAPSKPPLLSPRAAFLQQPRSLLQPQMTTFQPQQRVVEPQSSQSPPNHAGAMVLKPVTTSLGVGPLAKLQGAVRLFQQLPKASVGTESTSLPTTQDQKVVEDHKNTTIPVASTPVRDLTKSTTAAGTPKVAAIDSKSPTALMNAAVSSPSTTTATTNNTKETTGHGTTSSVLKATKHLSIVEPTTATTLSGADSSPSPLRSPTMVASSTTKGNSNTVDAVDVSAENKEREVVLLQPVPRSRRNRRNKAAGSSSEVRSQSVAAASPGANADSQAVSSPIEPDAVMIDQQKVTAANANRQTIRTTSAKSSSGGSNKILTMLKPGATETSTKPDALSGSVGAVAASNKAKTSLLASSERLIVKNLPSSSQQDDLSGRTAATASSTPPTSSSKTTKPNQLRMSSPVLKTTGDIAARPAKRAASPEIPVNKEQENNITSTSPEVELQPKFRGRPVPCYGKYRPAARAYGGSAVVGERLWIYGGTHDTNAGVIPFEDLWELHLTTQQWTQHKHPPNTYPGPLCKHSMVSWKHYLVLFGGWNGFRRCNAVWFYDTKRHIWEEVVNKNPGRYHQDDATWPPPHTSHAVTLVDQDVLMVVGRGETGTHRKYGSDIDFFDCHNRVWMLGGARFDARAGHSLTQLANGQVLMFGGRKDKSIQFFKFPDYCPHPDAVTQAGFIEPSSVKLHVPTMEPVAPPWGRSFHGMVTLVPAHLHLLHGGFLESSHITGRCLFDATRQIAIYNEVTQSWYELAPDGGKQDHKTMFFKANENNTGNNGHAGGCSSSPQDDPNLDYLQDVLLLPPRAGHALQVIPHPTQERIMRVVLFAGTHCGVNFNDVWFLDLEIAAMSEAVLRKKNSKRNDLLSSSKGELFDVKQHYLNKAKSMDPEHFTMALKEQKRVEQVKNALARREEANRERIQRNSERDKKSLEMREQQGYVIPYGLKNAVGNGNNNNGGPVQPSPGMTRSKSPNNLRGGGGPGSAQYQFRPQARCGANNGAAVVDV
ncbi:unnamed protein product [Amoebophrya sp. A120]|nr:unnamed protein product [Amoebophrya sp. A120]|eukprot:GSA120T00012805001.1